jgi:hypothetical protein
MISRLNFSKSFSFAALALMISACGGKNSGGGDDGGETLSLTASLGTGLSAASTFKSLRNELFRSHYSLFSSQTVDSVVAIPVIDGDMSYESMGNIVEGSIESGGNLSISIPKNDYEWVLVLLDSTQEEKIDQVVGYIKLSDAESSGLMKLDASDVSESSLDVGEITKSAGSDEIGSTETLEDLSDKFSSSIDALREVARTDKLLKSVKNFYANYDATSNTYYLVQPYYVMNYDADSIDDINSMDADFTDVSKLTYGGYGLYFNVSDEDRVQFPDLCGDPSDSEITLTPPGTLYGANQDGTVDSDPAINVLTNPSMSDETGSSDYRYCGSEGVTSADGFYAHGNGGGTDFGFNWGGGYGFFGEPPEGRWNMDVDGDPVATYEIAAGSPVNESGQLNVYLPSFRVIREEGSNEITKIQVRFYTYNPGSDSFELITDPTTMLSNIGENGQVGVELSDYNVDPRVSIYGPADHAGDGVFELTDFQGETFHFDPCPSTGNSLAALATNYTLNGASIRLDVRPTYAAKLGKCKSQ